MKNKAKMSVLFVCMGNICRSPTAEGVLRAKAANRAVLLEIDSCGTHAYHVGEPPDSRSQAHARRRGYDLSNQRARQLASTDFERFDLLFAMDRRNFALLEMQCPVEFRNKLKLFLEFSTLVPGGEVPDPYDGGDAGFERVLDLIEDASESLLEHIDRTTGSMD